MDETAERIDLLSLWMRHHDVHGETLRKFEVIIMYFKLYFEIKVKHHISYGPRHIVSSLKLLNQQASEVKNIITPVIQRGAYHAHSENVLASFVCSDSEEDRVFAVDKILKIRNGSDHGDLSVRCHSTPEINLDANTPKELIDWDKKLHEPVFTCKLNLEEINEIKNRPIMIPTFSLHTQSCERAVQEVAKSTCEVHGEKRRDGWVRARIAHREFMPVFNSKKDIANL